MHFQDCNEKDDIKINKKDNMMQYHMQTGNITTNLNVKIKFT